MPAKASTSKVARAYAKLAAFDIAAIFSRVHVPGPPRTVFIGEPLPEDYYDHKHRIKKEHVYLTNQVITSKYTVITFLPRNLLEQFRRVANIFFLGINILQFFPKFATISPGLVILPLLIVLAVSAIKDGYEDIKRHQSDRRVNHTQMRVLAGGGFENRNAIQAKSKTFVRGLRSLTPGGKDKGAKPGSADLEMQTVPTDDGQRRSDDNDVTIERDGLFNKDDMSLAHWKETLWEDLRVGDIIKLLDNEQVPADILICATSEEENVAFLETKNLDGETNLKSRNAAPALVGMRSAAECAQTQFRIDCDRPDSNMYKLNATIVHQEQKSPVELQMTMLRGTVVRNTGWVIGVVLFTGKDTKIVLNSGGTPSKRSKVERQMNPQVFINLALLAVMGVVCAIADAYLEHRDYPEGAPWLYGDDQKSDNPSINGLVTWAFALITFQNIVPISLYISIEFVRTLQAAFIYFDKEIYYEKADQPTLARSWNLSDDLGQIEYIFSDKTGTLTQNQMLFRQCSIGGRVYEGDADMLDDSDKKDSTEEVIETKPVSSSSNNSSDDAPSGSKVQGVPDPMAPGQVGLAAGVLQHFRDAQLSSDMAHAVHPEGEPSAEDATWARTLNGFFTVLSLCHTVLTAVNKDTGALEYKAQSPDEAALVQAAADVGFVFRGRDREVLRLQTPFADEVQEYELLNILEFTSARKRMSVVVRKLHDADARLFLLSKGADNVIFERLKPGDDDLKQSTETALDAFANSGLRTLTLAYKVIPEEYYSEWSHRYHDATVAMDDRETLIENVSAEIETDLRLLGATAIEDRLQDGVPETIADLKLAGIKIWVATGDKLETAIAIGKSTNLIQPESNIIIVRGNAENGRPVYEQLLKAVDDFFPESGILEDPEVDNKRLSTLQAARASSVMVDVVGRNNGERPGGFVLVIDGTALTHALGDEEHKHLLLKLATQCEGVICCRVSPLQKALVVKMVREGLGVMTLAIGDGANDVSMIQAADVGVGISGEEGLQAVNSSDYAIAQFRFLKRLLLVHGHWSYARNGNMIVNFFYKNIVCIGVLWWFQIYCAWSSSYVFEYTYLLFWNSFWTIAPVIAIGLFDRIIDDDVLYAIPELYRYGREGHWFGVKTFLVYMIDGIYQSAVIYFFVMYTYETVSARADGYGVYLYEFSTVMVLAAVITVNLFNGLNTEVWTAWVFFAVALGIVLVWLWTVIYAVISPGFDVTKVYGDNHLLFPSAYFWFGMILATILALAPRYIAKAVKFGYYPNDLDTLRHYRKYNKGGDIGQEAHLGGPLSGLKRANSRLTPVQSIASGAARQSTDVRSRSHADMSMATQSLHRGFDFSQEEGGIAIRRMQTNLSERRLDQLNGKRKRSGSVLKSIKRTIRRKKTEEDSLR